MKISKQLPTDSSAVKQQTKRRKSLSADSSIVKPQRIRRKSCIMKSKDKLAPSAPLRHSTRKTKRQIEKEEIMEIQQAVREQREDGLKERFLGGKGRGLFSSKNYLPGDYVVEYAGELISMLEATYRENYYSTLDSLGHSYMYYFKHYNRSCCVDATEDTGRKGRLVNHSRKANLVTKILVVDDTPRLLLMANRFIDAGVELTLDYGDRARSSLKDHPWLRT